MDYVRLLSKRRTELLQAMKKARLIVKKPQQGRIEIMRQGNHFRYYKKTIKDGVEKKTYLKASEISQASVIATRDYASQFLRVASREEHLLAQLTKLYQGRNASNCHEMLHPGRKNIVKPLLLSDDEFLEQWLSERHPLQNSFPIQNHIFTENGEQVRSKSEKIIADKLKIENIPYKYEEAVQINGKIFFPDFVILKKHTREIIYWEHFGLINQEEYQKHMVEKIETYATSGIVVGKNLIVTFETAEHPISVKLVEQIINGNFLV